MLVSKDVLISKSLLEEYLFAQYGEREEELMNELKRLDMKEWLDNCFIRIENY